MSPASCTPEWLYKIFQQKHDITYISANPYINSKGINIKSFDISQCIYNWNAKQHFTQIVDTWDKHWNNELGTIHPRTINNEYFAQKPKNKTILHYMQPHKPYLNSPKHQKMVSIKKLKNEVKSIENNSFLGSFRDQLGKIVDSTLSKKQIWWIRKKLNLEPNKSDELAYRKGDILYYYKQNLKKVLKTVSNLIKEVENDKKIIITSDHGEAFGEKGIWNHPKESNLDVLREIPWLELRR
ncbi:hypothetical protein C9439_03750 [archaeon SCG-AAA382B04]|nr:hypothetical protein C9439_03750 [archaeon SCG-AAA382B04]